MGERGTLAGTSIAVMFEALSPAVECLKTHKRERIKNTLGRLFSSK